MRHTFYKKILPLCIALLLLGGLVVPVQNTAHAQSAALADVGFSFLECEFSPDIQNALSGALDTLKEKGDGFLDSIGLGGITGFLSGGSESQAVPTADQPRAKESAQNCASAALKDAVLNALVTDVLEFVTAGDKGRFIQDYGDEFKQAADGALANVARDFTGVEICRPFKAQFELIVGNTVVPRDFRHRYDCTLSESVEMQTAAIEAFSDDFRNGGWDMWRVVRRQSSPLGIYLEANDQRVLALAQAQQETQTRAIASQGFKDELACTEVEYLFADGRTQLDTPSPRILMSEWSEFVRSQQAADVNIDLITCTQTEIITPGSVTAEVTKNIVDSERSGLEEADAHYEILNIVERIIDSDSSALIEIIQNGL